jgi:DNA-binding SARP family transcriptional activator
MRLCILGPLRVFDRTDREIPISRRQQRLLLARLLVDAGRPVSTDRLILDLWGDDAPNGARGSLQALVSRLRTTLQAAGSGAAPGAEVVSRPHGYALEVADDVLDAARFVRLAEDGRARLAEGRPHDALARCDAALALWHGDVLADLAEAAFVAPVATRLDGLRLDTAERRAEALLATGATSTAIAELEALTELSPLRERPWELLCSALGAEGRTAEALERLRRVKKELGEELGLDPGPGLQAVELALLRGERGPTIPAVRRPEPHDGKLRPGPPPDDGPTVSAPIGRTTEWRELNDAVERSRQGSATWVSIAGDPGMGKTTLVERLADAVDRQGGRVLLGRSHEVELAPAFWPWVQLVRGLESPGAGTAGPIEGRMLAAAGLVDGAPATSATPATSGSSGAPGTTAASSPAASTLSPAGSGTSRQLFPLFDAVRAALASAAREEPLLVIVEDVHWADVESLLLVDFLAVQLRAVRLCVVLTFRPGEGPPALERTLRELARQPTHLRIELGGLDTPATAEVVRLVTGVPAERAIAARLRDRTGGNPFFTVELARFGGTAAPDDAVPDTVREAVARRLERLSPDVLETITLAAIHGVRFRLDALVASSHREVARLHDHLDHALQARLLATTDDLAELRFAHALIQEVVVGRLPDLQRRRLHLQVAEALQNADTDRLSAFGSEVAHHRLAAAPLGEASETLAAAEAAARAAERRFAFHEAVRWWEGARRVVEADRYLREDQALRVRILLALGHARSRTGDQSAAVRVLADAIDAGHAIGDVAAMAEAAIAFDEASGFWNWVDYGDRPVELLTRLERVLTAIGEQDPGLRIRVLGVRGIGDYYGDQALGRRFVREAVELARAEDDPTLRLAALRADLRFLSPDRLEHQLATSQELLDLARELDAEEDELVAWTYRVSHLLMVGDLDGAERAYERAVELSRRPDLAIFRAQLGWTAAIFPLARGDLERPASLLEAARELQAGTGLYLLDPVIAWSHTALLWERDRLHELPPDQAAYVPEAQVALDHHAGHAVDAVARLRELCRTPHPRIFHALGTLTLRARVAADLGARELAPGLITELAPHEERLATFGSVACAGPVAIDLARLHRLAGDPSTATAMLRRCIVRCDDAGWSTWAARARRAFDEPVGRATGFAGR